VEKEKLLSDSAGRNIKWHNHFEEEFDLKS